MLRTGATLLMACVLIGCSQGEGPPTSPAARQEEAVGRGGSEITGDWKNHLGQRVTVHGKALNHKLGAYLEGDEYGIYVDLPDTHWPSELYFGKGDGEQVTVTGTVVERNDVPVFIPNPNKPLVQGVPVPEGTDLEGASKRYVLESVEYQKSNNGG